uniref:hypothetical protein n=1 Tax=Riemerella anatipestifer TaxID=34085 RepID=UPI0030BFC451
MINKIYTVSMLSVMLIVGACREQDLNVTEDVTPEVKITEASVLNGRLYFANKESLQFAYDKVKDKEDEEIAEYIDSKNIVSLRPIVTEKNEKLIAEKMKMRIASLKKNPRFMAVSSSNYNGTLNTALIEDDIDDLEEIIGDDAYGAFLNGDAEIQVADKIYKYTDVGLFAVKADKYEHLISYLATNDISDNLLYPTEYNVKLAYIRNSPSGALTPITDNIEYFRVSDPSREMMMMPDDGDGGGGGYSGGGSSSNDQSVNDYLKNLQYCDIKHGLFGNLFGENDVCIDRYEDRRRVKVKAYNYNYHLVYHLGAKVKHQYRGWTGGWRKEKVDEMRIGIEGVQFQYDYSNFFHYNSGMTSIYAQNNRYQFEDAQFFMGTGNKSLTITGFTMSSFPKILQDDIVIEDFGVGNDIVAEAIRQGNRQMTSDKLNKYFWEGAIKKAGDFWKRMGKSSPTPLDNRVTLFRKYPEFGKVLVHKTYYESAINEDKLEKTFDFGASIAINIGTDGNISAQPGTNLQKPTDFMVKMYGIVKKGGRWHGSKIDNTRK